MRHFLRAALAVAALAGGVAAGAAEGALVASAGIEQRLLPGQGRASAAVTLAAIAPRADQQALVAQRAAQHAGRGTADEVWRHGSTAPRGWTSSATCATCLSKPRRGGYGQARGVSANSVPEPARPRRPKPVGNSPVRKECSDSAAPPAGPAPRGAGPAGMGTAPKTWAAASALFTGTARILAAAYSLAAIP